MWRLGKRRRQCGLCKKTWTPRPRRRGRRRKRSRPHFSYQVVRENRSLRGIAETRGVGREYVRRNFHRSLDLLLSLKLKPPEKLLTKTGNLLIIADAIFAKCSGEEIAIIFVYLRPVSRDIATLASIITERGGESECFWDKAISSLSPSLERRIVALISDNSPGLSRCARKRGWIHQRCHFHLLAGLRAILGRHKNIRYKYEREKAMRLIRLVITEPNRHKISYAIGELRKLGRRKDLPRTLRFRVNGFLRVWREYRTYINYPKLRLPNTSNVAEAGGNFGRFLLRCRRGFKTEQSLHCWLRTIRLLHPTMTCKRADHIQN